MANLDLWWDAAVPHDEQKKDALFDREWELAVQLMLPLYSSSPELYFKRKME